MANGYYIVIFKNAVIETSYQTIFTTMNVTMINIAEAKTHLSKYAKLVKQGKRFILCDRNQPFAELRPLKVGKDGLRTWGLASGVLTVPEGINLPESEISQLFDGLAE